MNEKDSLDGLKVGREAVIVAAVKAGIDPQSTACLTGSQVYGAPRNDSDVDVVVMMPADVIEALQFLLPEFCGPTTDETISDRALEMTQLSLKCGKINIVAVSSPDDLAAWKAGTSQLFDESRQHGSPCDRERAIEVLRMHKYGAK